METLEQLKGIIAGKPSGATEFFIYQGAVNYIDNHENGHQFKLWDDENGEWVFSELVDGWQYIRGIRSLSDIERIIELMETVAEIKNGNNACDHDGDWIPSWGYGTCAKCNSVKVDRQWGIASGKWFKNLDEAMFYKRNGVLPK